MTTNPFDRLRTDEIDQHDAWESGYDEGHASGVAEERAAILVFIKRHDSIHERVVEALYMLRDGIESAAHTKPEGE